MLKKIISGLILLVLTVLDVAAEINLFRGGDFRGVILDEEVTAAYGWNMVDHGRMAHNWWNPQETEYLSGYDCFKLSFDKAVMTIEFLQDISKSYCSQSFYLYNTTGRMPLPSTSQFRISGEVKLDLGTFKVADEITIHPAENWQTFDLTVSSQQFEKKRAHDLFTVKPAPGMKISVRNFRLTTVYPPSKSDVIRLPGNGKLQKFVIPADADLELKYLAECWRSWFWRLTGTALPIVEAQAAPSENSFSFTRGETPPGGWIIKVNDKGGSLIFSKAQVLSPAMYDYLQLMKVFLFAPDCKKIPEPDADLVLASVDKTVVPRFYGYGNSELYGGINWPVASSAADWYTWDHPIADHFMNTLLPVEKYRQTHPEYYMLTKEGKRQHVKDQFLMSPCLSNEDAKAIIERRFLALANAMPYVTKMDFILGDRPDFCHCDPCRADGEFYTDIMMDMVNRLARKIAAEHPGKKIEYAAYLLLSKPPQKIKPEPNVEVAYCLPPFSWPCNVHVDCPENEHAINEFMQWSKITGQAGLGAVGYEEARPWHHLKQLELLNRHAKARYFTHCRDPQIQYITGRWNLGDDPDRIISEFNQAYYGAAGQYVTKIQRTIEDFCENYEHRPGELSSSFRNITVMSWVFDRKTILDRLLFDSIYPLLTQAFEAIADEKDDSVRKHLVFFKFYLLRMDLAKYRFTDCGSKEETAAFAGRLTQFIETCKEINSSKQLSWPERSFQHTLMNGAPARLFLQLVAGIELPTTVKDWTQEAELLKFLENPEQKLILEPVRFPGVTVFAPGLLRGGKGPSYYSYQCPRKLTKAICRPSSGLSQLSATLQLEQVPSAPLVMVLEGLDDDKPGASTMSISVNKQVIFSGANTFAENDWTKMSFTIPPNTLKTGDNVIDISNTVQDRADKTLNSDEGIYVGQGGKQDYTWGWISVSRLCILDTSSSLRDFIRDSSKPWSRINWMDQPAGIVGTREQTLYLQSEGATFTGVFMDTDKENRISLKAGETIRGTIQARGTGSFGFWAYDQNGKYQSQDCLTKGFALTDKNHISFENTLPAESKTVTVVPFILGAKNGAWIENIWFEMVREIKPDSDR